MRKLIEKHNNPRGAKRPWGAAEGGAIFMFFYEFAHGQISNGYMLAHGLRMDRSHQGGAVLINLFQRQYVMIVIDLMKFQKAHN